MRCSFCWSVNSFNFLSWDFWILFWWFLIWSFFRRCFFFLFNFFSFCFIRGLFTLFDWCYISLFDFRVMLKFWNTARSKILLICLFFCLKFCSDRLILDILICILIFSSWCFSYLKGITWIMAENNIWRHKTKSDCSLETLNTLHKCMTNKFFLIIDRDHLTLNMKRILSYPSGTKID